MLRSITAGGITANWRPGWTAHASMPRNATPGEVPFHVFHHHASKRRPPAVSALQKLSCFETVVAINEPFCFETVVASFETVVASPAEGATPCFHASGAREADCPCFPCSEMPALAKVPFHASHGLDVFPLFQIHGINLHARRAL